jgi:glycosyltransferase involved in cell wall biosynthesis
VASEGQAGRRPVTDRDPLRIVVVSHAYVTRENRGKLEQLGRRARVRALVPARGDDIAGTQRTAASEARAYDLVPLPILGRTVPGTRWLFTRCRRAWSGFDAAAVVLEGEPWSLVVLQALACRLRYCPRSALVLFGWESLRRPGWRGAATRPFYRLAIRAAAAIMVGSRDARALFLHYGADPARLFVTPQLGLDPARLHPVDEEGRRARRREQGLDENVFLVGFAGRLVPEKGVLDLVDAAHALAKGGLKLQVVLLGTGPLEDELRRRTGGDADVKLLPPRPRHEIAPFYQSLDAFVLPSRTTPQWKEQFGMVAAEAMACGVPVVGSSSGAIPDILGRTGLVFPEGDVPALAATLGRLASDTRLRAELGAAARRRSARLFCHEAVAETTLRVVEIGLGEHRDRPVSYCDVED